MLKTLRLHNFRTFLNAEVRFTHWHLVIGRNNSGKTNLCAALRFLGATATQDLMSAALRVPGGPREIKNWVFDSDVVEISCTCTLPFDEQEYEYTYDLTLRLESRFPTFATREQEVVLRVAAEHLAVNWPGKGNVILLRSDGRQAHMLNEQKLLSGNQDSLFQVSAPRDGTMLSKMYEAEDNQRAMRLRRYLAGLSYFALSPSRIRFGWAEARDPLAGLLPEGDSLAGVLFRLKTFAEARYRRVLDHVHLIEPDLEAINFSPLPPHVPSVQMRAQPEATWAGLSDGTLRCLALACIAELAGPSGRESSDHFRPLVIIEEPENGIFPGLLRQFFDRFEDRSPSGQFLFTTHSPYFIDFFDADRESVTLLRRSNERTEIVPVPPADERAPDRPMLADQYSMELFD